MNSIIQTIVACIQLIKAIVSAFLRRIRLIMYLPAVVLGLGGLGVWISLFQYKHGDLTVTPLGIYRNAATLFLSVVIGSFLDYVLKALNPKNTKDYRTQIVLLFILGAAGFLAAFDILIEAVNQKTNLYAATALVASVILWIAANWENENLANTDLQASMGGKITTKSGNASQGPLGGVVQP